MSLAYKLRSFTGSERYYRHPLFARNTMWTDGVQFFIDNAAEGKGAHWLLDIFLTEGVELHQSEPFVVMKVVVDDINSSSNASFNGCVIEFSDGNEKTLKRRQLTTDIEPGEWSFWLVNNTLMLPTEY